MLGSLCLSEAKGNCFSGSAKCNYLGNREKCNCFDNAAQGTMEYLVILGALIILSLFVVSLTLSSTPSTGQVSTQSNNLKGVINELELVDFVVDASGNAALVIKNNSGERLTIKNASVDENDAHIFGSGVRMNAGQKKFLC